MKTNYQLKIKIRKITITMRFNTSLFISTLFATLISAPYAFASNYIYTDLGTLGGKNSEGYGININGQVVGNSNVVAGEASYRPFIYSSGAMQDLGTLGGTNGSANSINDSGQVVGYSNASGDATYNPFLYSNGTMQDLGTNGSAVGINSSRQVVGMLSGQVFIYDNGNIAILGASFGMGYGINSSGQVSGWFIINN